MPIVGKKKYPYTEEGRRQAAMDSKQSGLPVKSSNGYGQGIDNRGGARTGMLSNVNRPYQMGNNRRLVGPGGPGRRLRPFTQQNLGSVMKQVKSMRDRRFARGADTRGADTILGRIQEMMDKV